MWRPAGTAPFERTVARRRRRQFLEQLQRFPELLSRARATSVRGRSPGCELRELREVCSAATEVDVELVARPGGLFLHLVDSQVFTCVITLKQKSVVNLLLLFFS